MKNFASLGLRWGAVLAALFHLQYVAEGAERFEDAGDLILALFVLSAEAGGEGFRVWADGGQELAKGGDLGREFGRPVEKGNGRGGVRGGGVVLGECDFAL